MTAGRIILYITAAILILFGVLMILGSGSPQGQSNWLFYGAALIFIGFGIIWFATRKLTVSAQEGDNITYKLDLPADVSLDVLECQSCGGELTMDHIEMVAGAPVVNCPYCNTTYQLKEEPKW
jgi:hypothetical protein